MKFRGVGCVMVDCDGDSADTTDGVGSIGALVDAVGSVGSVDSVVAVDTIVAVFVVDDVTLTSGSWLFLFQWSRNVSYGIPKSRAAARMEVPISMALRGRIMTSFGRFSVLRLYLRTIFPILS